MRRFPLPFQPKSPTCTRRERQKKLRKSGLTDRILPSAQTASESHSMRLHERVAKGGAATVNGDECRSWAGHQVMLARVPHHQTTAPGRPSRPAAPGPVTRGVSREKQTSPDANGQLFAHDAPGLRSWRASPAEDQLFYRYNFLEFTRGAIR